MRKRRVAFVASIYGHFAAFHLPYLKLFQEKGYEVHVFAKPDLKKKMIHELGVICHDIPFERSPLQRQNIYALKKMISVFNQVNFDLVHVHTPVASILGRIAAKMAKVPIVIYTAHGFHFYKNAPKRNWIVYYPVERYMSSFTDYLILINQEDYHIAQRFPVRKKTVLIPGVGLDTRFYGAHDISLKINKRKELQINANEFVILYIAELNRNKNHSQLLKALRQIHTRPDRPIRVLLAGLGEEENELRHEVKQLNLTEQVDFLGFRSDIPELIAIADLVTLMSIREGLPRALMEAMAGGKPILASSIRGNRDLIVHNENGFLVPLFDVPATADALMKLYIDDELRNSMGQRSLELVKKYDIHSVLTSMEELYDLATHEALHKQKEGGTHS